MDLSIYAITTFLALGAGSLLLLQARHNAGGPVARVYVTLTAVLVVVGLAAIGMVAERVPPVHSNYHHLEAYLLYGGIVLATTLLVHLALLQRRRWGPLQRIRGRALVALYVPAMIVEALLWLTPFCVNGFHEGPSFDIPNPGPLYWLLRTYTTAGPFLALGLLAYAAYAADGIVARLRSTLMAAGLGLSMLIFVLAGWIIFRLTYPSIVVLWPLTMALFLAIAARALFRPPLPDLLFYVPGSRHRRERLQQYARVRLVDKQLAELRAPTEMVQRLAALLEVPVTMRASGGRLLAASRQGDGTTAMPHRAFLDCRRLWVREEVRDRNLGTYRAMVRYGVSAILPLYPYSDGAAGWLLLGEPFEHRFYSQRDFREIEPLFERTAECVLDQLLALQAEADQQEQLTLEREKTQHRLEQENEALRRDNSRLLRERPADTFSLISTASQTVTVPPTLTLLGRDKSLLAKLREEFPQLAHYVGPGSESFRKQPPPDVLIAHIPKGDSRLERQLLRMMQGNQYPCAFVLYGGGAHSLVEREHKRLLGRIVTLLPSRLGNEALTSWIKATAELRRATLDTSTADHPLVGRSQVFIDLIGEAMRAARFADPIVIRGMDRGENLALARLIHDKSGQGPFVILPGIQLAQEVGMEGGLSEAGERILATALRSARGGTLLVDRIRAIRNTTLEKLVARVMDTDEVRLIAGLETGDSAEQTRLPGSLGFFALDIPSLVERGTDVPLLAHYYNLLFNLQAASDGALDGNELDALLQSNPVETQSALKALVFEQLSETPQRIAQPVYLEAKESAKTLDEHVAEFEAELIRRTLERCNGNKSKAARLLGLRPNTLHYKMVRHGLTGDRRKLDDED